MERRNRGTLLLEFNNASYLVFFSSEIQGLLKTKGPNHFRALYRPCSCISIFSVSMGHLMTEFLFFLMYLNSIFFVPVAFVLLSLYSFVTGLKILFPLSLGFFLGYEVN